MVPFRTWMKVVINEYFNHPYNGLMQITKSKTKEIYMKSEGVKLNTFHETFDCKGTEVMTNRKSFQRITLWLLPKDSWSKKIDT